MGVVPPKHCVLKHLKQSIIVVVCASVALYMLLLQPANGVVGTFAPTTHYDTCFGNATQGLAGLNTLTIAGDTVPLHLPRVKARFERELSEQLYSPSSLRAIAARSRRFFPIVVPILKKHGIPRDFKYVLAVESQGDDNAVSRRGATGLWQFMAAPARDLGLRIDNEVDERMHLEKSTEAACRHIKALRKQTGSWTNALAAYNVGVNKFLRISDGQNQSDYFKLWLNKETNRYVFKIIAIKELMERPRSYGLQMKMVSSSAPATKRLRVSQKIENLFAYAAKHGTDYFAMRELNPWIIGKSLTPATGEVYYIHISKSKPARALMADMLQIDSLRSSQLAFAADTTLAEF